MSCHDTFFTRSNWIGFARLLLSLLLLHPLLAHAEELLELKAINFELYMTNYKYAAILFYDTSARGRAIEEAWIGAAEAIEDLGPDAVMAKIDGTDPDLKELIDAYGLTVPSVRVFRRGVMGDYRGPYDDTESIRKYIVEDSEPSVKIVKSLADLKQRLEKNTKPAVLGFFDKAKVEETDADGDVDSGGYAMDTWGQFVAAADSLRGHAVLFAITSTDIIQSFEVKPSELPVIYMISEDGDGLIPYKGEILELNLSEWVLSNSSPSMGELTFSAPSGELYATQFFSSRKLKFILFLRASDVTNQMSGGASVIDNWQDVSQTFRGKALFAYLVQDVVADVVEYFNIDVDNDLPLIVAHDPSHDYKYKSARLMKLDTNTFQDFVAGVLTGAIKRMIKSEPEPKSTTKGMAGGIGKNKGKGGVAAKSTVVKLVGTNVVNAVSSEDKDVLLEVYAPWCAHCKKLAPTFDILGKAVQGEQRILLAKIDGTNNDLPPQWKVKGYPTLLWFPAKDKPYNSSGSIPRPYWDAGHSLHEMFSFIIRESSFDPKTLKVATSEQLGSLLGDEETLRAQYEEEERWNKRNEGRVIYENEWVDFLAGEVVFDGKRWHVMAGGVLVVITLISVLFTSGNGSGNKSKPITNISEKKKK